MLMGIALAMPLLLPQFYETSDLHRLAGDGIVLPYLGALFVPYPLASANYPGVPESPHFNHMGQLYYAGTIFSVAAAIGMASLLAHRWNRRLLAANVWLPLAWMALILSTGRIGGLWYLFGKIPPFTGFEHPFKFIPFAVLFMLLGGALLIDRALRHTRNAFWQVAICTAALGCMAYHIWLPLPSFCNYGFQPYPSPPAELQALRDDPLGGRILAIGPNRSLAPEYGQSLMHQWPTVWGFDALGGYDPLVSESPRFASVPRRLLASAGVLGMQIDLGGAEMKLTPQVLEIEKHDPIRSALNLLSNPPADEQEMWGHSPRLDAASQLSVLEAYGVHWVVVYSGPQLPKAVPGIDETLWKHSPNYDLLIAAIQECCPMVVNRPEVKVYELANPAPSAFVVDDPTHSLPIHSDGHGTTVDTRGLHSETSVVVNMLPARNLQAFADGRYLAGTTDAWGRMLFQLPKDAQRLQILYRPPWLTGATCGACLAACAVLLMRWRRRIEPVSQRFITSSNFEIATPLRPAA